MAEPRQRRGDAGFTIIEVLVALAVLGLVLGAVYRVYGTGIMAVDRNTAELRLALAAESILERTRADLDPRRSDLEGRLPDGTAYRVEALPLDLPKPLPQAGGRPAADATGAPGDTGRDQPRLWAVRVTVADPAGNSFALTGLRWLKGA
ncbi:MAG: prepilin-type N-terminal cleavage/methylation domain-containing protein [Geminicoccaceae bacterium]